MQLPKIMAAGIYDSKIAVKNTVVSKKRKTTMFEIELPIEECGVSYIDSECLTINKNVIICAKPGQIRHTKFPYKCYYIHMILHNGEIYDILSNAPSFIGTKNYDVYKNIFERFIRHYNLLSEKEEILLQGLILELTYLISKENYNKNVNLKSGNNDLIIEKSVRYIENHLSEDITLKKLSQKMLLSPVYFHNIFKRSVGKTLHEYVEEQRIKKAINLLQTTDYNLTKIAFECGFSSQSYFSFVFKRKMKMTPRDYIKESYNKYGQ
ncbi:MAG: helix-turn-helix transcriptional regulator [Clostridia bacterium]|nr:helix-turn-helix transcriptional regulator [Clostridia bacterium]MBO5231697.1 helix-turn-helix transcriptional regulator [Clostridia bacterium]